MIGGDVNEKSYIPFGKLSKKAQKEMNTRKRKDWGGLNPVTRKPPNPKAYNRKKSSDEACDKASYFFAFSEFPI